LAEASRCIRARKGRGDGNDRATEYIYLFGDGSRDPKTYATW